MASEQIRDKEQFLDAWSDPVAGVRTLPGCLTTADVFGDGEHRLVACTRNLRLKVWKDTHLQSEHILQDEPTAIARVKVSNWIHSRAPVSEIAVAAGPCVFIYHAMRPYFRFELPSVSLTQREIDTWHALSEQGISITDAIEQLQEVRDNGDWLSDASLALITAPSDATREDIVAENAGKALQQNTVATCLASINKNREDEDAISQLIVGTEHALLHVLDHTATKVDWSCQLPAPPVFLATSGLLDVDYKILALCRDARVYSVNRDNIPKCIIELRSHAVGLVKHGKTVHTATMDQKLHSFQHSGKKNHTIPLGSAPTCIEPMSIERANMTTGVAVGLATGTIMVFNGKHVVVQVSLRSAPVSMRFGPYGRETNVLSVACRDGSVSVKILPRSAQLHVSTQSESGPPKEQDTPLPVPKKSKLYVEQAQREKEQCVDIHRVFQKDLSKLRLSTARAYVKVLTDGQGPVSYSSGSSLRLHAHVQGMGPLFRMSLNIQNSGSKSISDVPVMLSCDPADALDRTQLYLPILLPGANHVLDAYVRSEEGQQVDSVKVFVCNVRSAVPYLSALVKLPAPELAGLGDS